MSTRPGRVDAGTASTREYYRRLGRPLGRRPAAPGARVGPGTVVKAGQLWAGVPAKAVRDLTADELAALGERPLESTRAFWPEAAERGAHSAVRWRRGAVHETE